jgi:glycosyltransferase involved in cell wall biosynthesis
MKVLHLISSSGYYGAESMLITLVTHLRRLHCDVHLCVLENQRNSRNEILAAARQAGVETELIPCHGRLDLKVPGALRRLLDANNADVMHTHGYKSDIYGYVAARSTGIPLVSTCHGWTAASIAVRMYSALDKFVLRAFNRVVGVSAPVAAELVEAGVPASSVVVIHNGVRLSPGPARSRATSLPPENGRGAVVAMVGRIVPQKGVGPFLHAASDVLKHFPRTEFLVAGEGPARERYEAEACALGISNKVRFTGYLRDITSLYAAIDIMALPSLTEGLPMAILEAMAAEKAVVASRVGAIPDVITDRETGLLVEPGDATGLARALCNLISDGRLRARLAQDGRALIEKSFSAEKMARSYLRLYETMIVGSKPGPETMAVAAP